MFPVQILSKTYPFEFGSGKERFAFVLGASGQIL